MGFTRSSTKERSSVLSRKPSQRRAPGRAKEKEKEKAKAKARARTDRSRKEEERAEELSLGAVAAEEAAGAEGEVGEEHEAVAVSLQPTPFLLDLEDSITVGGIEPARWTSPLLRFVRGRVR